MPEPLSDNPLGEPFVELNSIDSTNNYALAQIHAGMAQHGHAFFAWEQYAGKGQRGKTWTSEKGHNLIISLIVNPQPLLTHQQFQLSVAAAVATARWLTHKTDENVRIKWPNDIYWHDRKAGGILIESVISANETSGSQWKWAVIGIGLNINQGSFSNDLPNPVSLLQITGKTHPVNILAKELCAELESTWQSLRQNKFAELLEEYNQLLFGRGRTLRFKQDNRSFQAVINRVDENGKLWVREGVEKNYAFGEIQLILPVA